VTFALAITGDFGATGIWIAVAVGDVVGCLAAMAWFTRGTWKDAVVGDGNENAVVGDGNENAVVGDGHEDVAGSPSTEDAGSPPTDPVPTDD
jgi:hypothetical protein